MIEICFWLSAGLILYIYLGFPLLVFLRGRFRQRQPSCADITPTINVIIVAHNEEGGIRRKLDNLLTLDYPSDRLATIVASDGSDDSTNEIVAQYQSQGMTLLALPRQGKIPALNAAVSKATAEILVFSDANSLYAPNAIRALVRPFADTSVGGVAGNQSYLSDHSGSSTDAGERAYWNFDQSLKRWQSVAGSVTSATGAIYAIRRKLFEPVPGGVGDDAAISYRVIARGYRMVFEPAAIAYEPVAASAHAEFQRKVRVCARGLRGLLVAPELFNPFRYGFYSLQLFSHKLLRWLVIWPLLVLFLGSLWLASAGWPYRLAFIAQLLFYGSALRVFLIRNRSLGSRTLLKIFTIPFYFCLANIACLFAQFRVAMGQQIDVWEVRRASPSA